jgi:hypothetical protein
MFIASTLPQAAYHETNEKSGRGEKGERCRRGWTRSDWIGWTDQAGGKENGEDHREQGRPDAAQPRDNHHYRQGDKWRRSPEPRPGFPLRDSCGSAEQQRKNIRTDDVCDGGGSCGHLEPSDKYG